MRPIYLLMSCVLLSACGGSEFDDLQDFVKNSGANMRGKISPPPVVKLYEPFAYVNSTNLTDPFKPRKPESGPGSKRGANEPDMDRPKQALEEFPLESLKMVGYVYKSKVGHAVVRAPDKKAEKKMMDAISTAEEKGDTVGGVFTVAASGLFPGLGSHAQDVRH